MIGKYKTGVSFYHLIQYCLEDKKESSMKNQSQYKDRAEVLEYNLCFGDKRELNRDFLDVAKLSRRVEKPVLHISLRLAPGDELTPNQMIEIGRECAKEFGVADHQYISVLHKDTHQPHIHIVANRVGFDGKVASDSNSYKRMAALCRRLEMQYQLKQVLSPRKFLSPEERLLPRQDMRKERLKADIRRTLEQVSSYPAFEQQMKTLGYQVIKGRGISFIDDKKVKVKGSEVGFSLTAIERILSLKEQATAKQTVVRPTSSVPYPPPHPKAFAARETASIQKELTTLLRQLVKPEQESYTDPELGKTVKRKKKRLREHL